ncbi:hypothetical protein ACNR91_001680 [Candidozyma auris]
MRTETEEWIQQSWDTQYQHGVLWNNILSEDPHYVADVVGDVKLDELTDISVSSSDLAPISSCAPAFDDFGFTRKRRDSSSCSLESDAPSTAPLRWIDESKTFFPESNPSPTQPGSVSSDDVDKIRKRLRKRKHRPSESGVKSIPANDKRMRNTLAARRYRERQRKDVEILDNRIKQIEEELNSARLEIMWWKMESQRWREEAEKLSKSS